MVKNTKNIELIAQSIVKELTKLSPEELSSLKTIITQLEMSSRDIHVLGGGGGDPVSSQDYYNIINEKEDSLTWQLVSRHINQPEKVLPEPKGSLQIWQPSDRFTRLYVEGNTLHWQYYNRHRFLDAGSFTPQCSCVTQSSPYEGLPPVDEYKCKASQWLVGTCIGRAEAIENASSDTINEILETIAIGLPDPFSEAIVAVIALIINTGIVTMEGLAYLITENKNYLVCEIYHAPNAHQAKLIIDAWINENSIEPTGTHAYILRLMFYQGIVNQVFDGSLDAISLANYNIDFCQSCLESACLYDFTTDA